MKYIHENECPLDDSLYGESICVDAIGDLDCLKYLHENGYEFDA